MIPDYRLLYYFQYLFVSVRYTLLYPTLTSHLALMPCEYTFSLYNLHRIAVYS